jgi:hypothetical protein
MRVPGTVAAALVALSCGGPTTPTTGSGDLPDVPRAETLLDINWTDGPYTGLDAYCARLEDKAGPVVEAPKTYDELPPEDTRIVCNRSPGLDGTLEAAGRGAFEDVRIVATGEHLVRCQVAMKTAEGYVLSAAFDCYSDHSARQIRTEIDDIKFVGNNVVVRWTTESTIGGNGFELDSPDTEYSEMVSKVSFIQVCGTEPNVRCIDPIPTRGVWSGFPDVEGSYETTVEVGDGWIVLDGEVGGSWNVERYAQYGHNRFLDEVRGLHVIEWK